MEIHPVYTKLNQICSIEDAFFKLIKEYSPSFLFINKSKNNRLKHTIIGRNPYISIFKKKNIIRLQIANELFEINTQKNSISSYMKEIQNIIKFHPDIDLNNKVPFYSGFSGFKNFNCTYFFIPTEVIVINHIEKDITIIANTYHKEKFESEIFFRANVKIARIINDMKKESKINNLNKILLQKPVIKKNTGKVILKSKTGDNFETLYFYIVQNFKKYNVSVFCFNHYRIISLATLEKPTSNFKFKDFKDAGTFIDEKFFYSGYINFNLNSDFCFPLLLFYETEEGIFLDMKNKNPLIDEELNKYFIL
ncbi:MAG: hypothetical protein ACQESP_01625 [Candidatus Muiribacteriota bacterium]